MKKQTKIRDERIAAETDRIYKVGYYIFTFGIIADIVIKSFTGEPFDKGEWVIFLAAQFTCLVLSSRRGIYTEDPGAERFNWRKHLLSFGAVGAVAGALIAARNAALYGPDALTIVLTFVMILVSCVALGLLLAYAAFAWAKSRRSKQEQELED